MKKVFIGSEALAARMLTRGQLRWNYTAIFPNVYVAKGIPISPQLRATGAWLWTGRRGIIAGRVAAAFHGAKWVDDCTPVELIHRRCRVPAGVIVHRERIDDVEIVAIGGLPVTSMHRTALDLGRHLPVRKAVAHLDSLANATGLLRTDVMPLVDRYAGARGLRKAQTALGLMDGGAQSPKETWLRLVLLDAGLPPPVTQLKIHNGDGYGLAFLDLGWEEPMVGVEYDGDHHRTDRRQYEKDVSRLAMLERRGWIIIRVTAGTHPNDVVDRVREAFDRRGWTPRSTTRP